MPIKFGQWGDEKHACIPTRNALKFRIRRSMSPAEWPAGSSGRGYAKWQYNFRWNCSSVQWASATGRGSAEGPLRRPQISLASWGSWAIAIISYAAHHCVLYRGTMLALQSVGRREVVKMFQFHWRWLDPYLSRVRPSPSVGRWEMWRGWLKEGVMIRVPLWLGRRKGGMAST